MSCLHFANSRICTFGIFNNKFWQSAFRDNKFLHRKHTQKGKSIRVEQTNFKGVHAWWYICIYQYMTTKEILLLFLLPRIWEDLHGWVNTDNFQYQQNTHDVEQILSTQTFFNLNGKCTKIFETKLKKDCIQRLQI